ncbi:phospholipid/cholesterol/gamma-HCH transport system permease protein [Roseomonas rosea]|uniref:Phospholipid/cholesterol/gamma-HCH transport system permease protein n=1 Tax=Muricoccus roseus TaxID=198092 RepID=A0A1M6M5J5_9PROT|nr:ABC transporter permease [Roseomonas rosea]SHJ78761.1 phospholipid/cholesterol/gamma-HCH transport system permease protein [Roseomonas rosea]
MTPLGEGRGDRRAGRAEGAAERASAPGSPALPPAEDMGPGPAPDRAPEPGAAVEPPAPAVGGRTAPVVAREGDLLRFSGELTSLTAGAVWRTALKAAEGARRIDLSGLEVLDTSGATLVIASSRIAGEGVPVEGASRPVAAVLERVRGADRPPPAPPPPPRRLGLVRSLGAWGVGRGDAALDGAAFLGEASATVVNAARRPRDLRASDVLRHLDEVGTRAFGLVMLLGVLIGVILAFQSAIPMRQYGADIFVPRLVGISLLRELGPLLAAVILAGRTGSAFAAELGTMTVNEEVSALRIMGIDPMVLLVLPRLIAATIAMPVLALLMDLSGLVGMAFVMLATGFPLQLVINQVHAGVALGDLLGGLGKAAVFGLVIAGIGCRAGLSAGSGPRAVGDAATAAVVGGIVALVVLDGIFAVLFYRLGW